MLKGREYAPLLHRLRQQQRHLALRLLLQRPLLNPLIRLRKQAVAVEVAPALWLRGLLRLVFPRQSFFLSTL
jgi:hypothetical protein